MFVVFTMVFWPVFVGFSSGTKSRVPSSTMHRDNSATVLRASRFWARRSGQRESGIRSPPRGNLDPHSIRFHSEKCQSINRSFSSQAGSVSNCRWVQFLACQCLAQKEAPFLPITPHPPTAKGQIPDSRFSTSRDPLDKPLIRSWISRYFAPIKATNNTDWVSFAEGILLPLPAHRDSNSLNLSDQSIVE